MAGTSVEVLGTVRSDGTLELHEKLELPPGQVRVHVEAVAVPAPPGEGLVEFVDRIRREAEAAGSHFMGDGEVLAWVEELRSEPDRIEEIYRQAKAEATKEERPGC